MVPGWAGAPGLAVTASVWAALVPQELVAVTETVPPVAFGVTVMLLLVEEPLQPVGSVQV